MEISYNVEMIKLRNIGITKIKHIIFLLSLNNTFAVFLLITILQVMILKSSSSRILEITNGKRDF